jgi:long-chain fatty acid transport protein
MRTHQSGIVVVGVALVFLLPALASATNGYFAHGVGMKAKGMAGATVALPQDALSAGSNPAATAHIGNRVDIGVDLFRPDRFSEVSGNDFPGIDGVYEGNETQNFFVPEVGVTRMIADHMGIGLAIYGRGGMNTDYATPFGLFGTSRPGVDLSQLFVVPSFAVKLNDSHTVGFGVDFAYQRFEAKGLENFEMMSSDPDNLTNNEHASSVGFGWRIGWIGHLHPMLSLGAAYQSKTHMSEFDEYAGLFAGQGDFDIPDMFTGGLALAVHRKATVVFDVSHIRYSEIPAVANPLLPNLGMAPLGSGDGAGFGWEDVTAYKSALVYDHSDAFTLRGGWNYAEQPIPESETLFNFLAPGVVEHHLTLGGTWRFAPRMEITAAYMHAFEKTVEGMNSIIPGTPEAGGMGGGEVDLTMFEDSFGVSLGINL